MSCDILLCCVVFCCVVLYLSDVLLFTVTFHCVVLHFPQAQRMYSENIVHVQRRKRSQMLQMWRNTRCGCCRCGGIQVQKRDNKEMGYIQTSNRGGIVKVWEKYRARTKEGQCIYLYRVFWLKVDDL